MKLFVWMTFIPYFGYLLYLFLTHNGTFRHHVTCLRHDKMNM